MTIVPAAGDILFCESTGKPIDRLIVARTGSQWVHVKVAVSSTMVVEAVSGGVRLHATDAYQGIARVGARLKVADPARFQQAQTALLGRVGDRYGIGDLLDQLLNYLPGHPVISWDRSEDCSDLAVQFLTNAGYTLPFATVAAAITPGSLADLLKPQHV
jgi:hypothetical protein